MTLIVENGSIVAGANSYASVADADAYYLVRANAAWAALTNEAKEAALILGTDFIEATYSQSWLGDIVSPDQPLSWPRVGVRINGYAIQPNVVPDKVKQAAIEMALRASAGEPLIIDEGQRVTEERVDVLTVKYAEFSDPTLRYPYVNRLLTPYLRSGSTDGGFQQPRLVRT